jgi:hypothetical protein
MNWKKRLRSSRNPTNPSINKENLKNLMRDRTKTSISLLKMKMMVNSKITN